MIYRFYEAAIAEEARNMASLANLLRLTGYTAKDLDRKGNTEISKVWDTIIKPLSTQVKKRRRRKFPLAKSRNTGNMPTVGKKDPPVVVNQAAATFLHGTPAVMTSVMPHEVQQK